MYNVCLLIRIAYLSLLAINVSPRLHVLHTPPLFQVELEKDDWE